MKETMAGSLMTQIYERLNQCTSFAGDQYLYAMLRLMSKDSALLNKREEKIQYFKAYEKEREELQITLMRLGKKDNSYYLPMILNNLKDLRIEHMWFYRMMQVLLIAAGILFVSNLLRISMKYIWM